MRNFSAVFRLGYKLQWRKFRGSKKKSAIASFCVLGIFYLLLEIGFSAMLGFGGGTLGELGIAAEIFTLIQIIACAMTLLFALLPMMNMLFFNKDAQFFSTLPVSSGAVFSAKMLRLYLNEVLFTAALFLIPLSVFGFTAHLGAMTVLGAILAVFIIPSIPMFLGSILCIPLMYVASFFKSRSLIGGLLGLLCVAALFVVYFYAIGLVTSSGAGDGGAAADLAALAAALKSGMSTVKYIFLPMFAVACVAGGEPIFGVSGIGGTFLALVLSLLIPIAMFGFAYLLSLLFFRRAVSAQQESKRVESKAGVNKSASIGGALIKRDFKNILRVPGLLINYFIPILFGIILPIGFGLIFGKSMVGEDEVPGLTDMMSNLTMYLMIGMMSVAGAASAMSSFSREGKSLNILRAMPIEPKSILSAKLIVAYIPVACTVVFGTVAAVIFGRASAAFVVPYIAFTLVIGYFFTCNYVRMDFVSPNLSWTSIGELQNQKKKLGINYIIVFGVMFFYIIIAVIGFVLPFLGVPGTVWINIAMWIVLGAGAIALAVWQHKTLFNNCNEYWNRLES